MVCKNLPFMICQVSSFFEELMWEPSSAAMTQAESRILRYVTLCAIWYNVYNLKNVKTTHVGVLLLVKLQAISRKASHVINNLNHMYILSSSIWSELAEP